MAVELSDTGVSGGGGAVKFSWPPPPQALRAVRESKAIVSSVVVFIRTSLGCGEAG